MKKMIYHCKANKRVYRKKGRIIRITCCYAPLKKEGKIYRCPQCNSIFSSEYIEYKYY